eukprot:scaffold8247_cov116-Isochrysis_galbana.AAC.1
MVSPGTLGAAVARYPSKSCVSSASVCASPPPAAGGASEADGERSGAAPAASSSDRFCTSTALGRISGISCPARFFT